ncbi:MAG TPA: phosphoglucosamine mutase [Moorella mulderi]|nr:phosphoglucosamine mutase [Moorella mulderi]
MGILFGTDGVRGVANSTLTPELALKLGRAGAAVLACNSERPLLVVGKDTRVSGDMLEAALVAGVLSVGGEVLKLGIVSTPAVAWLTRELGASAGVMISASHNPVEDNGIKFFSSSGYKLPDELEEEIEKLVLASEDPLPRPTGARLGSLKEGEELKEIYISHVLSLSQRLKGLRVVLDCAYGANYYLAPEVFRRLGAEVHCLHAEPDGSRINVNCGSTCPEALQREVVKRQAHLGLAFDGDGDRVIAMDEKGQVVDGDAIMAVLALYRQERGGLPGGKVVVTVMSNWGLHQVLREAGLQVFQTKVGDRYVLEEMLRQGAVMGGEQSGHIILLEHNTTGDGLITGLQLCQVVLETGKPLSQLASRMIRLPQILVNVPAADKKALMDSPAFQEAVVQAQKLLEGRGRVLVRPSGTEPLVRIMAEGPDEGELKQIVTELEKVAREISLQVS